MSVLLRRAGLGSDIGAMRQYPTNVDLTTSALFPAIEVTGGDMRGHTIGRKCRARPLY
jgi:hypothetical protein